MAVPSTPTNFYVQQGNSQVYLSWDLSTSGATDYPVQRSTDGVTFVQIADPSTNFYLDTNVTPGTQYYYQIAAHNISGTSAFTAAQLIVPTVTAEMTLGQIRLMSQQRADRVNSNFVTLPEWNTYINQSYFELYDLLTTLYEDYYLAPPVQINTDGTSQQYALPDGTNYKGGVFGGSAGNPSPAFYKLMGVDCGLNQQGNAWVTLRKYNFIARNRFVYPNISSTFLGVFNLQYRLMGNSLYFIPTPSGGQILRVWYIPRVAQLLKDNDILDGVSGWTEYVVVDAAIKALQKEESDTSLLVAQKQALRQRIEESAMNRDAGQPDTISDTRSMSQRWGNYGSPGGDGSFGGY